MTPSSQRRRSAEATRRAILDATRRLIEARGAESVRLEDVAAAAGCSRRAIYLHFKSRTDLLLALPGYIDAVEGLSASINRVWKAAGPLEALDAFAAHIADYHPRIAAVVNAIDAARHTDLGAAAVWNDRMTAWRNVCVRVVRLLEADGLLADGWSIEQAADLMWALMSVRLWQDLVVERGWSRDQHHEGLRRTLQSTLVRVTAVRGVHGRKVKRKF